MIVVEDMVFGVFVARISGPAIQAYFFGRKEEIKMAFQLETDTGSGDYRQSTNAA